MTINNSNLQRNGAGSVGLGGGGGGSSSGIFVFEADTAAFANRKRAARACASCQKRKKRCPHTFTKSPGDDQNGGVEKVLPHLMHKEPVRFVGDMNPESIMTDLGLREKGAKRFSRVGTWVEQSRLKPDQAQIDPGMPAQNATLPPAPAGEPIGMGSRHAQRCAVERYSKIERGRRTLTGHQKNYLQAVGAFRVLPKATQDALITTYIACIDPLLPIIDGTKFLREYTRGDASVFLVQAVCMVACKTEEAAPYLRFYEDGPLLDPIPFARSLHTGLDAAMKADLEGDRFTKVQILTLMSLHNDGPGGIEESSLYLVQAIHDAQTTGMHIDTPGRTRNDQGAQLWWTLWALDKFNACLGGRPLMIAERDIDIQMPNPVSHPRSQALAVWMALGHLLDQVIEFYRPVTDPDATGWERDFPSWAELTQECDLGLLLPSHQSCLEICYNIIGILACRSGGPSTLSYNRRVQCADRIQTLVTAQNGSHLPPVPLIPYAASLSLTVAYRGLRDQHTDPTRVVSDLTTRCEILERLSSSWWTADALAKLGRKALKSLQNPALQLNNGRSKSNEIADEMEAEVTACKYHPFGEHKTDTTQPNKSSTRGSSTKDAGAGASGATDTAGNALHVLSDAAATHGMPGLSSGGNSRQKPSQAELNNDSDIHAKRRRMDSTRRSHNPSNSNSTSPNATSVTDSAIDTPTLIHTNTTQTPSSFDHRTHSSSSHHAPPDLLTPATTISHHTPHQDHQVASHIASGGNHNTSPGITDLDPFAAFDANALHTTDYADLDNLFDGFFDLRLPTMFQDPLFDGAAYFSMGPEDWSGFVDGSGTNGANDTAMIPNTGPAAMGTGMGMAMSQMPVGINMSGSLGGHMNTSTAFDIGNMAQQGRNGR